METVIVAAGVGSLVAAAFSLAAGIHFQRRAKPTRPQPFTCGCGHHKAMHDAQDKCQEVVDWHKVGYHLEAIVCSCQHYVSVTAFEMPELP